METGRPAGTMHAKDCRCPMTRGKGAGQEGMSAPGLGRRWRPEGARAPMPQKSSAPIARFSNRVWFFWKNSFTVPVGPLRCLPMMTSAMLGSLESLL